MMPGPARSRPGIDSDAAEDQREDEDQRDAKDSTIGMLPGEL